MSLQKMSVNLPQSPTPVSNPTLPNPGVPEKNRKETELNNSQLLQRLDFVEGTQFMGGPKRRSRLKMSFLSWASMLVDHCIVMGMTCLFLIAGSLILKTTMQTFIKAQDFFIAGVGLYIFLAITYFVICRAFVGATAGEYSCELRLGAPNERQKKNYSLKVIFRSVLILFSGVIILPLLSLLFGKDISGKISGISIYSLK